MQHEINKVPTDEKTPIMGDLNARIGNEVVVGIKNKYNEDHINEIDKTLIEYCASNMERINRFISFKTEQPGKIPKDKDHRLVLCKLRLRVDKRIHNA